MVRTQYTAGPTCASGETAASSELPLMVGEATPGNPSNGVVGLPDRRRAALAFLLALQTRKQLWDYHCPHSLRTPLLERQHRSYLKLIQHGNRRDWQAAALQG